MSRAFSCLGALALVAVGGCAHGDVKQDLVYVDPQHADDEKAASSFARFDLYEPPGSHHDKKRPAVIAIHGGAWIAGDKTDMKRMATELCSWGYVVLAVNYRLAPDAKWPSQLEDCRAAYRHFRAHARDLRIDPDRIAALGVSAGAHLAAMLELRDDPEVAGRAGRPRLGVAVDGEYDMALGEKCQTQYGELMKKMLGHGEPWSKEELADLSPLEFARQDCSVLLIHGAHDPQVFVANADELDKALRDKNADVQYVRLEGKEGECHATCWMNEHALAALHRYLDRRLK